MAKIITELQDLTRLSWAKVRYSSGTAGSFLKSYEETDTGKMYYKLSNYDAFKGITGHECINEIIVDRLLSILGVEHLEYNLIYAKVVINNEPYNTWLCSSADFKKRGDSKIALDAYYQIEKTPGESPLDFCIRQGWEQKIYQMLVVDFLIMNRDRHGANVEVLRNRINKTVRLAPLFDHGLSLFSRCPDLSAVLKEEVMADKPVQCFVGSNSAVDNLKLIPRGKEPVLNSLDEKDKDLLLEGLKLALDEQWLERIWELIWRRWQFYEDFCDKR